MPSIPDFLFLRHPAFSAMVNGHPPPHDPFTPLGFRFPPGAMSTKDSPFDHAGTVLFGDTLLHAPGTPVDGGLSLLEGEPYLAIRDVDGMAPFLMSVVSASDHWLFAGSNGAFTAGRVDPDGALFPYQTVDKILRHPDSGGAFTSLLVTRGGRCSLWEPWREAPRIHDITRTLHRHVHGTSLVFEEENRDLGLRFRCQLTTSEPYGFVRRCTLENLGGTPVRLRCLDGWHQIIPPGVSQDLHARLSYLAAAYMRHELPSGEDPAIYTLHSGISDRPQPSESLRAACAWSLGHNSPKVLLSTRQVEAFRRGEAVVPEREVRGEFGAYLVEDEFGIAAGGVRDWFTVADVRLDHRAITRLRDELRDKTALRASLLESIARNREQLRARIAAADGLQETADLSSSVHHFANVLFNCMRGGTLLDSYRFPKTDLLRFLGARSPATSLRCAEWLADLPETMLLPELRESAAATGDPQLERVVLEYLPITFSRRHGDPSRPWNRFSIRVKDERGEPVCGYQGNWRDIFQNWESLARSYPLCLPSMISVFLNASTADGYNPYRITREGIDWEVLDPHDPWAFIGYWGDHQIIYLLRLLEGLEQFEPGRLSADLASRLYSYAVVPYRIAGLDRLLENPRDTITFDTALHDALLERSATAGGDGKMHLDGRGDVLRVSLAEKLLVPLLVKLGNLVPGGGIWLNTQRPEWNDANNALAGWGLSMVTVCHIRRYLSFLDGVFARCGRAELELSGPVAALLREIAGICSALGDRECDDAARLDALKSLGMAGERHRQAVYSREWGAAVPLSVAEIRGLFAAALPVIDATIRCNRRDDGMYHGYNLLKVGGGKAVVSRLDPMLEGQAAVLGSSLLSPREVLDILASLRRSALYRPDQHSYMLYPDREIRPFLERNTLPESALREAPVLADLTAEGNAALVTRDGHGGLHFQADLTNEADLAAVLDRLGNDPRWSAAVARDRGSVLELWEQVFRHSAFTGRSSGMFGFEGLGSIYWHMVAKLLLAVQESCLAAAREGSPAFPELLAAYYDVRAGLGFTKPPAVYGAFPADPYSHTPRDRGAQQPGMTGQVKEEILTRFGELGVMVEGGCLRFAPRLLRRGEFRTEPGEFRYLDLGGAERSRALPAGSLAFTCCQVPVCYVLGDTPSLLVEKTGGGTETVPGDTLPREASAAIFARSGAISGLTVTVRRGDLVDGDALRWPKELPRG